MKIDIVGNHCSWTKSYNTSFLIDDEIVFDVPIGSFKTISNDYDLKKVKYIIISHFHTDHFGDITLLIEKLIKQGNELTILAPKSCKERIVTLMRVFEISHLLGLLDKIKFIDSENGKIVKLGKYKVKCYAVCHGNLDAYGYTIDDGENKAGFSGDSSMCNSIRKIAKNSKAMFIDASNVSANLKHLATYEIKALSEEFKQTTFYPVHLSAISEKTLDEFDLIKTHEKQTIIL